MGKSTPTILTWCLSPEDNSLHYRIKEQVLETYRNLVRQLICIYDKEELVTETVTEIAHFVWVLKILQPKTSNGALLKTIKCPHFYDEYVLNGIFIEWQLQSTRRFMDSFCRNNKPSQLQNLTCHYTSLHNLKAALCHANAQARTITATKRRIISNPITTKELWANWIISYLTIVLVEEQKND